MANEDSQKLRADTEALLDIAHDWMLRLEAPDASPQERSEFENWINESPRHYHVYDQALTFRAALTQLSERDLDADITKKSSAEKLTAFLDGIRGHLASVRVQAAAASLAAAFIIAIAAPTLFNGQVEQVEQSSPSVAQYASPIAETRVIELSDGSKITLGAASRMTTTLTGNQRSVELISGTAYFDVAHDENRPFSVKTGDLTATVLGTAFDVRRGADSYSVAVAEGSVEVAYPFTMNGTATAMLSRKTIKAGQQIDANLAKGLGSASEIDVKAVAAWRENRLVYKGETLAEVLFDANRYSAIPIEIPEGSEAVKDLRLRGVFMGSDIDRLLSNIAQLHPVEIDRSVSGVILVRDESDPEP